MAQRILRDDIEVTIEAPTITFRDGTGTQVAQIKDGAGTGWGNVLGGSISAVGWYDPTATAYGAKCDGMTDDAAALAACIADIPDGGVLFLKAGTGGYYVKSQIVINKRINIIAEGPLSRIWGDATFADTELVKYAGTSLVDKVSIRGLHLELPDGHTSHLLTITNVAHANIEVLNLEGGNRALNLGPIHHNSYYRSCRIANPRYGVYIAGDTSAAELFFSQIDIVGSSNANTSSAGFAVVRTSGGDVGGYYLTDVLVSMGTRTCDYGFLLDASASGVLSTSPLYLKGCAADAITTNALRILNWGNVFVTGSNWFYSTGADTIYLDGVSDCIFVGNIIKGNGNAFNFAGTASTQVQIGMNRIPSATYAFYLTTAPTSIEIQMDAIYTGVHTRVTNDLTNLIAALSVNSRWMSPGVMLVTSGANQAGAFGLRNRNGTSKYWRLAPDSTLQLMSSSFATVLQAIKDDGSVYFGAQDVATTVSMRSGSGSPEGVVTAGPGSVFFRTDGGAGTSFYVKESGTGSTGWVAK